MRVSLNTIIVAALLGSIPFASVVRSYPIDGYIDIVETSKRGFPKPPGGQFRDPSPPGSDPFRTPPNNSPSPPGGNPFRTPTDSSPSPPGSPAGGWRGFANGDLKLTDPAKDGMRVKGAQLIQDLEKAIQDKSPSKKKESVMESGYTGQSQSKGPPKLKSHPNKKPYDGFGFDVRDNWIVDDIKRPGTDTILKTYEKPDQKAIIISHSWNKEQDPNGKLPWSAMVMSNWREAAKKEKTDPSELRHIVRDNVQAVDTKTSDGKLTLNTVNAMNGAFAAMGKKREETLTLDFKTKDKTELQQVSIMSAQTHIARVLQMLKDYRDELKDLQISKIHLQSREHSQSDSQNNIIIELGR